MTQPTEQDLRNAAVRREIADRQAAEYHEAEAVAAEALAPGWKPCEVAGMRPGDRFGKWVVLQTGSLPRGATSARLGFALCRCDCGAVKAVNASSLRRAISRRCSECYIPQSALIHGGKGTRLYGIWAGMLRRCRPSQRKNRNEAKEYYERGIRVCPEWSDFAIFRCWALANGYQDNLTIDRWPNKLGNYEPGNCRWVTGEQQQRNKSTNRVVTAFGESKPVIDWGEDPRCRVKVASLYSRLSAGWPAELAIATPPLPGGNQYVRRSRNLLPDAIRAEGFEPKKGRKR